MPRMPMIPARVMMAFLTANTAVMIFWAGIATSDAADRQIDLSAPACRQTGADTHRPAGWCMNCTD